jgi:hypothetical protein
MTAYGATQLIYEAVLGLHTLRLFEGFHLFVIFTLIIYPWARREEKWHLRRKKRQLHIESPARIYLLHSANRP